MFKILNATLKHFDHQYKQGLNVLDGEFVPSDDCGLGGLYITDEPHRWIRFGTLIAPVTLPDDAQVCGPLSGGKYKVDKLFLGEPVEISDAIYHQSVQTHGMILQYVPDHRRTREICLLAMRTHGLAIYMVPTACRNTEMCVTAMRENGMALECIPYEERTKTICNEAVHQNPQAIDYVPRTILEQLFLDHLF